MIKFKLLAALLSCALFVLSCNPNDDISGNASGTGFSENFGTKVARDFIGQIVDVEKNPIENATVTIGNSMVQTDKNGVFIVNDAFVFEKLAHIKSTKSGYIDGSRSMVPTSGKNRVLIMMMRTADNAIEYIESGVTTEVTVYNGTKIIFDGAFQDDFGRNYSGTVRVDAFHLTPSDDNLSSLMPGMLYAEDKNGQEKVLETYGMLNVELFGNNGQKLQIAKGHTAEIRLRIDDTQLASAPNTIPLWHFDEVNGYWKEEGFAIKQGNKFVGKVAHFSWWNCDVPFPTVTFGLSLVDTNGNPLSGIEVGLVKNDTISSISVRSYTDEQGSISGLVPSNETMQLNVYDNCGTIIYTSSIGPFSSDTVLPTIVVTNFQTFTITGNLLKCNNANVTNGYVYFKTSNRSIFQTVINGGFTVNTHNCAAINNFSLQGFDFDELYQTTNNNYAFTGTSVNVGNLQTCTLLNEYVTFQTDNGAIKNYTELDNLSVIKVRNGYRLLVGQSIATITDIKLRITTNSTALGTFNSPPYVISGVDLQGGFYINAQMPNTLSFHLINYGDVGDFVDLTADGSYYDLNGTQHTLHLVAHVLRDN